MLGGLDQLIAGLRAAISADGKRYGRINIDIHAETLLVLDEREARARHQSQNAACRGLKSTAVRKLTNRNRRDGFSLDAAFRSFNHGST